MTVFTVVGYTLDDPTPKKVQPCYDYKMAVEEARLFCRRLAGGWPEQVNDFYFAAPTKTTYVEARIYEGVAR